MATTAVSDCWQPSLATCR